jgi:hypothetical protein
MENRNRKNKNMEVCNKLDADHMKHNKRAWGKFKRLSDAL